MYPVDVLIKKQRYVRTGINIEDRCLLYTCSCPCAWWIMTLTLYLWCPYVHINHSTCLVWLWELTCHPPSCPVDGDTSQLTRVCSPDVWFVTCRDFSCLIFRATGFTRSGSSPFFSPKVTQAYINLTWRFKLNNEFVAQLFCQGAIQTGGLQHVEKNAPLWLKCQSPYSSWAPIMQHTWRTRSSSCIIQLCWLQFNWCRLYISHKFNKMWLAWTFCSLQLWLN